MKRKKLTYDEVITISTALDIYFAFGKIITKEELNRLKNKIKNI